MKIPYLVSRRSEMVILPFLPGVLCSLFAQKTNESTHKKT